MRRRVRAALAGVVLGAGTLAATARMSAATPTGWQRISASPVETGRQNGVPQPVSMDRTGDVIAFVWYATGTVPHAYVWESATNASRRIAIPPGGDLPDSAGEAAAVVSRNGRYVIFTTRATNFVPGDTNGVDDVFATELATGRTWPVSVGEDGRMMGAMSIQGQPEIAISDDGRFAVFVAFDLATHTGGSDVYVRDSVAGTTTRITAAFTTPTNPPSNVSTGFPTISADGRFVVFGTYRQGIWIWDRVTGQYERVDVPDPDAPADESTASALPNGPSFSVTPGGRYVAFASTGRRLTHDDVNSSAFTSVYVRDRLTGRTELESKTSTGVPAGLYSGLSHITLSTDGLRVGFDSYGFLTPDVRTNTSHYFVRDRETGEVKLASQAGFNQPVTVRSGAVSDDGTVVALVTYPWSDPDNWGDQLYRSPIAPTPPTVRPPDPPSGFEAVAGDHSVTLRWLKPASDGGSPIIGYTASASPGGNSCSTDDADVLSCTITGLTNGVSYTFTVTARNGAGSSQPGTSAGGTSEPVSVVVGTPPGPVSVLPPVFNTSDGTTATIRWLAASSDPNLPIIGYRATASPGGQFCETTGALSCTITGLTPGTSYTFTVTAINGIGPSPLTAPTAPVNVSATQSGYRSITLNWAAPTSSGGSPITRYDVAATTGAASCTTATTSCTINGLTPGSTYSFTATATNASGTSPSSAPSEPVSLLLDDVAPIVSGSVDRAPNAAGWYRLPVTVTWTATDPSPSSGAPTVPVPTVVSSEGAAQVITSGESCDPALNCANGQVGPLNIDRTPPVIALSTNAATYGPLDVVRVSCGVTDELSGVAANLCPAAVTPASSLNIGLNTLGATATDVAGNSASASATFTVLSSKQWLALAVDRLRALPLSGNDAKERDKAVTAINEALRRDAWTSSGIPTGTKGKAIFDDLHDAAQSLAKIDTSTAARQIGVEIVAVTRLWAAQAISAAAAVDPGSQDVAKARQHFALGDQKATQNSPGDAVDAYRNAWKTASAVS